MKRIVLVITLSGVLSSSALTLDMTEIKQRGKLLVITAGHPNDTRGRPRFLSRQGDSIVGIEGELLVGFTRLKKLELELVFISDFHLLVPALLEKKGDLIAGGVTNTEERRKLLNFTVETFPTRDVVVTRRPHRVVVQTIEQLREEHVGVMKGTSFVESAKAAGIPPKNIKILEPMRPPGSPPASPAGPFMPDGITATIQGVEMALAPPEEDPDVQIGMFLGRPQSLAMGVRKEDTQLLLDLNEYIGNIRKTPTWNRLVIKYFGARAIDVLRRARGE